MLGTGQSLYGINVSLTIALIPLAPELSTFIIGLRGLVLVNITYFPLSWIGQLFCV